MASDYWHENVGTHTNPVIRLHEYAVGIIWDELQKGLLKGTEVRVLTSSGDMSGNLLEDVADVRIPTELTPIGGSYPDIALFDEDHQPIRVVEVVVTRSPDRSKVESLTKRGVKVVETVKIAGKDDLKNLCWQPSSFNFAIDLDVEERRENYEVTRERLWTMGGLRAIDLAARQREADREVGRLCEILEECCPDTRRRFLSVMRDLDSVDSLIPLSPENPKRSAVMGTDEEQ